MSRSLRNGLYVLAAVALLALGAAVLNGSRAETARVDAGPVGERIVARGVVVPSAGVSHVYAAADGRVLRVLARESEQVAAGQALLELEVNGKTAQLGAPIAGIVLARHAEAGDYALAAAHGAPLPLFELADPKQTELRAEVEEVDAQKLALALPVSITASGLPPRSTRGVITRIAARLERRVIGADDARVRADGMVRVAAIAWQGAPPDWPLGTRAEAVIELAPTRAAARIPRTALAVHDGRTVVDRRTGFLAFTRETPVEVLRVDDAYAEIRGLAPGTEVLVRAH